MFLSLWSKAQFSSMINDTLELSNYGSSVLNCICYDDSFYYANVNVIQPNLEWGNKIVKLDKNFQIVNERSYIDTIWMNGNYPYNTIVVNATQILICPQITISTPFTVYGKIVALNKHTLDTLWTKVIEHPDTAYVNLPNATIYSVLTAIKETPDKGYILTGNYNLQCSGADKRSFLLKIDSIGNVEWRRAYSQYYTFFDVELAADSGYFVPSTINDLSLVLVKFDKNGVYQWKTFVNSNTNPSYPMDVTIHGNHAIVSSVFWYDISNSLRAVTVSKVDIINHSTMWEKNYYLYNSIECVGLHQAMGVETLPDGSIIVNGTVEKYGTDKSAFILKLNSNGDSLWTKTHRFKNSNISRSQLNDLMICDDGGFLGVGFYSAQAGAVSSAWMFKTDKNGVVGWESSTPLSSPEIKIWPNPAHNYTTLSLSKPLNQESKLIIYNTLGQKVKSIGLQKNISQIEISLLDFQKGIYYFEILTNNKIIGTGRIIKE